MDGTIIQQGSFISTGAAQTIQLRSDVDWMRVINFTKLTAQTNSGGTDFYWQRGFAANDGIITLFNAGSTAINQDTAVHKAVPGFTLVDSSITAPGPSVALTAVSNANPPVVTTGSTATLSTGDVVRLINVTGAHQVDSYLFSITVINGTTFSLTYGGAGVVTVAGTTGFWRKIPFNPLFSPATRSILNITKATSAVVTVSVTHNYIVGQQVRMAVPSAFGMTEMDGLTGTITAVTAGTFTLNIDSTAFTTFTFPLTAAAIFTKAQVVPFGETASATYANLLDDAVYNTGYIGMVLGAGLTSPAGLVNDVMYWRAGKSFSNS